MELMLKYIFAIFTILKPIISFGGYLFLNDKTKEMLLPWGKVLALKV